MSTKEDLDGFAIYKTEYGNIRIGYKGDYIVIVNNMRDRELDSRGEPTPLTDMAISQLNEYFTGKRKKFDLPLKMVGTEFQQKVWRALCDIPYGETRSYKEVAIAVSNPKGPRAVGMANNKNPLGIVVPCHRVVGSNGKLVGYATGLDVKERLLYLEAQNK